MAKLSPPLRERLDDLPQLAAHLFEKLCRKNRKSVRSVTPDFFAALSAYSWPGNVRELENVLERSLILSRSDTLTADVLPPQIFTRQEWPVQGHYGDDGIYNNSNYAPPSSGFLKLLLPTAANGTFASSPMAEATPSIGESSSAFDITDNFTSHPLDASHGLLDEAERDALLRALDIHGGHREKTADALGISRRTLQYKLKKFGLTRRA